jgi:uncharacterized damage-inducible protein DinB
MQVGDVYLELFGRVPEIARSAVDGLTPEQLVQQVKPETNPIGWLVWHLTRVQDHHVAELLGELQLWETGDWPARFGLDADPSNIGYGHSPADVATVRPESAAALVEYQEAVHARTSRMLEGLTAEELDRVVDRRWDPPVTLGVRLVSIADDGLQHAGQAAYARGLLGW